MVGLRHVVRSFPVLAAGTFAAAVLSGAATAQTSTNIGTLNCNVASGWGFILGSSKDLNCTFSPSSGAEIQRYKGSITKVGVDIGYTKGGVIIWAVFAPSNSVSAGQLAGNYVGATAEATIGGGLTGNVLVGGGNSIALQPISVGAQEGLNVAGGIGAVSLTYVP